MEGKLIIVRGLPGAGKTHILNELTKMLEFVRLDPDADRDTPECQAFANTCPSGLNPKTKVYRFQLKAACKALLADEIVIWEQPWRNRERLELALRRIREQVSELSGYSRTIDITIVEVSIPVDIARTRVTERNACEGHYLPISEFEVFVAGFEDVSCIGVPFVRLDGTQPISESVDQFYKLLTRRKEQR